MLPSSMQRLRDCGAVQTIALSEGFSSSGLLAVERPVGRVRDTGAVVLVNVS